MSPPSYETLTVDDYVAIVEHKGHFVISFQLRRSLEGFEGSAGAFIITAKIGFLPLFRKYRLELRPGHWQQPVVDQRTCLTEPGHLRSFDWILGGSWGSGCPNDVNGSFLFSRREIAGAGRVTREY